MDDIPVRDGERPTERRADPLGRPTGDSLLIKTNAAPDLEDVPARLRGGPSQVILLAMPPDQQLRPRPTAHAEMSALYTRMVMHWYRS
jgi:hypothetical protein